MAGARMGLDIADRATGPLGDLATRAGDPAAMLDEIGAALVLGVQERFEAGEDPEGRPWTPSLRALVEGGQTLIDRGHLRDSITHLVAGDEVAVGTNLVYGAIHQYGGAAVGMAHPARPYLGLSRGDEAEIDAIVADYFRGLADVR